MKTKRLIRGRAGSAALAALVAFGPARAAIYPSSPALPTSVVVLDPRTGAESARLDLGSSGPPALGRSGDQLVVASRSGDDGNVRVRAYAPGSATPAWTADLDLSAASRIERQGDLLVVAGTWSPGRDEKLEVRLFGLDATSGTRKWSVARGGVDFEPTFAADGDLLYLGIAAWTYPSHPRDGSVLAIALTDGAVRWERPLAATGHELLVVVPGEGVVVPRSQYWKDGSALLDRASGKPRWENALDLRPSAVAVTPSGLYTVAEKDEADASAADGRVFRTVVRKADLVSGNVSDVRKLPLGWWPKGLAAGHALFWNESSRIVWFDFVTDRVEWALDTDTSKTVDPGDALSAPGGGHREGASLGDWIVDADQLYLPIGDDVWRIDRATGIVLWKASIPRGHTTFGSSRYFLAPTTLQILHGSSLSGIASSDVASAIYALDRESGALLWKRGGVGKTDSVRDHWSHWLTGPLAYSERSAAPRAEPPVAPPDTPVAAAVVAEASPGPPRDYVFRWPDPMQQSSKGVPTDREEEWLKALDGADVRARDMAIKGLGFVRSRKAVPKLLDLAASDDERTRMAAIAALEWIGDPGAAPKLLARARSQEEALYAKSPAEPFERRQFQALVRTAARSDPERGIPYLEHLLLERRDLMMALPLAQIAGPGAWPAIDKARGIELPMELRINCPPAPIDEWPLAALATGNIDALRAVLADYDAHPWEVGFALDYVEAAELTEWLHARFAKGDRSMTPLLVHRRDRIVLPVLLEQLGEPMKWDRAGSVIDGIVAMGDPTVVPRLVFRMHHADESVAGRLVGGISKLVTGTMEFPSRSAPLLPEVLKWEKYLVAHAPEYPIDEADPDWKRISAGTMESLKPETRAFVDEMERVLFPEAFGADVAGRPHLTPAAWADQVRDRATELSPVLEDLLLHGGGYLHEPLRRVLRDGDQFASLAEALVGSPDEWVQREGIGALAWSRGRRALPRLVELLPGLTPDNRAEAAGWLRAFVAEVETESVLASLRREDVTGKEVGYAPALVRDVSALRPVLTELLRHPDEEVRKNAAVDLLSTMDTTGVDTYLAAILSKKRFLAAAAPGERPSRDVDALTDATRVPFVIYLGFDEHPDQLRLMDGGLEGWEKLAAWWRQHRGEIDLAALSRRRLSNPQSPFRVFAASQLAGPTHPEIEPILREILTAGDAKPGAIFLAARALQRYGSRAGVPKLIPLIDSPALTSESRSDFEKVLFGLTDVRLGTFAWDASAEQMKDTRAKWDAWLAAQPPGAFD